jgi:thiol-disulfide isomerase/thioredoxin
MSQRRVKRERQAHNEAARKSQPPARGWMKVAFIAAVLIVAGAIAAAVALSRSGGGASASAPVAAVGSPVSESRGSSLALRGTDPVTGKQVSLAAFAGKPIVLNIWASWCTGCVAEARALASFERAHPEAQVVGIDIQDSKAGARAFYRRFGWRHPSIFDPSGSLAARLGLQGLPTTIFLDRRHRVVGRVVGETDLAGFTAGFRQATT